MISLGEFSERVVRPARRKVMVFELHLVDAGWGGLYGSGSSKGDMICWSWWVSGVSVSFCLRSRKGSMEGCV